LKISAADLKELKEEVKRIDSILGKAPFDAINTKFQANYQKRGFDDPWYKVYGVPSIRSVADELGRLKEYTYIYSILSGVTHGSDIWKNVFFGKGEVKVGPLREPQNIPRVVQLAATLALRAFRLILTEFRSGEEENFDRKYVEEWREQFWKKYQIQLNPKTIRI